MLTNTTYDPILLVEELPRFRLRNRPCPPPIGAALVLDTARGTPVVVWPGQLVPQARLGNYRLSYLIDVEPRPVRLAESLPSKDPAFLFGCVLSLHCQVDNPALVAHRGVRDVMAVLRLPMVKILRAAARQFDIHCLNEAEEHIDQQLSKYHGDSGLRITKRLVELFGHAEYNGVTRNLRLDSRRREEIERVLGSRENPLHTEHLANGDGAPWQLIELGFRELALRGEQAIAAMRIQAGEDKEDYDTHQARQQLLKQVLGDRDVLGRRVPDDVGSRHRPIAVELASSGVDIGVGRKTSNGSRAHHKTPEAEPGQDRAHWGNFSEDDT